MSPSESFASGVRRLVARWLRGRGSWTAGGAPVFEAATAVREEQRVDDTGRYRLLSKYLRDRYASRVVLTFGEIEDLVGFPLPESARDAEWWGGGPPGAPRTPQSDAWRLASRTAVVNLPAQRVVFDREAANRRPSTS